jgi:hypothetical protein
MSGTDNPPSTTSPRRAARRALTTTMAALAAIAAPLALVTATGGSSDPASAGPPAARASALGNLDEVQARNADDATLASIASLAQAVAPPTSAAPTTTAPPAPTTTTTAPPPPPPAPAVQPVVSGGGYNDPNNPAAWDRLAQCESGGNWAANTGNGYYGGIQFSLSSWQAVGGTGRPDQASRETQIAMGQRLWNQGGWSHWPACSSRLGYR